MFHNYRADIEVNVLSDSYPSLSVSKLNDLTMLAEAIELSNKHDINKPSYDAYHINRFLNCQNSTGVVYNYNKKLDFGRISRIFLREENICDQFIAYREVLLESFKKKYHINSTPKNTLCIADSDIQSLTQKGTPKFFFNTELYPDAIIDSNLLKIKDIEIRNKTFFVIVLTNRQRTIHLSEMIDYNLDALTELIEYIYNNTTSSDIQIVLVVRGFYTEKYKKIISFFSGYFEKCNIYCTLVDINKYSNFVYFSTKKNKTISQTPLDQMKKIPLVENCINHIWKEMLQIKVKLSLETKILNYLFNQINTFNLAYDLFQLIILKDNIEYVKNRKIPYNLYYQHLLNEKMLTIKPQLNTLSPIISSNYANIPENILDYYTTIHTNISYKSKSKSYNIDVIKTIDDIMFFDLCNNNFIFENNKTYHADPNIRNLVEKYIQFYNIRVKSSDTTYNYLFIEHLTYESYNLISGISTDCKVIIKVNILDKQIFDNINNLFRTFENKFFYAPLMGQLYTTNIYIILDKYNQTLNNTYYVDFEKIIYSYLVNNKIVMDYMAILYGPEYLEKEFMKKFLNNI